MSDYLKKYLSSDNKKKKKKSKSSDKSINIIEEDAFIPVKPQQVNLTSDEDDDDISKNVKETVKLAEKLQFKTDGFQEIESQSKEMIKCNIKQELDSDVSPARNRRRKESNSDVSSPRNRRRRRESDSDVSPPRNRRRRGSDSSPPRRKRKQDSDSDASPPRIRRTDIELSRKRRKHNLSPSRRKRNDLDENRQHTKRDKSIITKIKCEPESDLSPPRRRTDFDADLMRRGRNDDLSPLRNRRKDADTSPLRRRSRSPVRKIKKEHDSSPPRKSNEESSPKTLEGKKAGLVTAEEMRKELKKLKEREKKEMDEMDDDVLGRYAETKIREPQIRKGKRRNKEDEERKEREEQKTNELKSKYEKWNLGIEQLKKREEELKEEEKVIKEGFARHADDKRMNKHLKDVIYEDDPMAEIMTKKKTKINIKKGLVYPTYQGQWPPNRFNIPPGYRWDGVDRSNGFESKLFLMANKRKADEASAYRAITELQE